MSLKRKSERSKENRRTPEPTRILAPHPQPGQQNEPVYQVGFTIGEIDMLMRSLIEANIPIQTYMLLDKKFNAIKRKSLGIPGPGSPTFQSKINQEVREIPDWEDGVEYKEGDRFIKRDPFGIFMIKEGRAVDITIAQERTKNEPGETN